MRLSEAVILYLTVAAPFGAASFVRLHARASSRPRALASAALAALTWPAAAFLMLRPNTRGRVNNDLNDDECSASETKIERAQRALAASLVEVEGLFERVAGQRDEKVRHTLFAARRSAERFVGLALAAKGVSPEAPPDARELELYRAAGRTGEDLLLAGRCAHRRNVLRLLLHRERARHEMLHALSEVRETACALTRPPHAGAHDARQLSGAVARAYELAVELFSNLDDPRAVAGVARLLDAERARLRQLDGQFSRAARTIGATEGVLCTTPAAATASAPRHQSWTETSGQD